MIRFRIALKNSDALNFYASPETTAYEVSRSTKYDIAKFLDCFVHDIILNKITLTQDYDECIHDIAKNIVKYNPTDIVPTDIAKFFGKLADAIEYENSYGNCNMSNEVNDNDKNNQKWKELITNEYNH